MGLSLSNLTFYKKEQIVVKKMPVKGWQKILSRTYAIVLGVSVFFLSLINTNFFSKRFAHLSSSKISSRGCFLYMIVTTFTGWAWCLWAVSQGAWDFHWWTIIGVEFYGMTIEDWLICPMSSYLFWVVFSFFKTGKSEDKKIPSFFLVVFLISFPFFGQCGQSLIGFCIVPGLLICIYTGINQRHFASSTVAVVLFAGLWDLWATTIGPKIWPWYEQWYYPVGFYKEIRIGNSPVEITPLFGIAGAWFCYGFWRIASMIKKPAKG